MINVANVICSDYVMIKIVSILKRAIDVIRLIAPILLMIGGTITFSKGVFKPDESAKSKTVGKFLNGVFATVIVMFLPFIINTIMLVISTYGEVGIKENNSNAAFQLSSCWTQAGVNNTSMNSTNSTSRSIYSESWQTLIK